LSKESFSSYVAIPVQADKGLKTFLKIETAISLADSGFFV
jgi:hypothetical protein